MTACPPFVDVLDEYVRRSHRKPKQLSELTGLPIETIKNWIEGRVRRPREWRDIAKLARALHLSEAETTALLRAAGHAPVAELAARFPEDSALLALWLSKDGETHTAGTESLQIFEFSGEHPPTVAPLPPGSRMLLRFNPLFVGRDTELLRIGRLLCAGDARGLGAVAALTGSGGIGKTQLAVEVVHRFGQFFAGGVFWLSFADHDSVATQIANCGGAGGMQLSSDFAKLPLDDQVRAVCTAWQQPIPRLLVFDNCEDGVLLRTWLPVTGGCRVLLTSRKTTWDAELGLETLALDVLPRQASRALLIKHRSDLAEEEATLDAIAAELGDLPLALHLAGSYLARYRRAVTPAAYLEQLQRSSPLDYRALTGVAASPTAHLQHVARTFALSFERLRLSEPTDLLARALLGRAAYFAPGEPIPRHTLARSLRSLEPSTLSQKQTMEDALLRLTDVGLLGEQSDGSLRLHRLVAASVRALLPDQRALDAVEQALAQLAVQLADAGDIPYVWRLQTHLHLATDRALAGNSMRAADLAHGLGYHLWLLARYEQAEYYLEQALELRGTNGARDPLSIASSYNLLGLTYQVQSRFSLARSMFEQAIELWKAHAAPDDPALVDDLHNLGYLHMITGNYHAAEGLLRQGLYARRKRFGLASLQTIRSLNSVGYLSILQGRTRSAIRYLRLALAAGEHALPERHPMRAMTMMFMGHALYRLRECTAALTYLHRSARMWQELFGIEVAAIAETYARIGRIMDEQGDSAAAWSLLEQALAINERVMGSHNCDTAFVLAQFGIVARRQGRLVEARAFLERSHSVRLQILGVQHPDTIATAEELAELARDEADPSANELLLAG